MCKVMKGGPIGGEALKVKETKGAQGLSNLQFYEERDSAHKITNKTGKGRGVCPRGKSNGRQERGGGGFEEEGTYFWLGFSNKKWCLL